MSLKLTGYDFWNDVLKNPRYVAAPMVDMSELSFRMLCRSYNAQLCYSPMLHSQQFLQDSLYRQDNFSTCLEDRPLIVQFCANEPSNFVNAASLVSSQCDAVDLNLGCPQAIAKKGYYGAFLQDDWDLVHSIVKKAATELPVPVTCKMRILPGAFRNSVQYAKMLEDAGCSVITVHGRTREQKGHATGLASWDAIKEIKSHVKIPVISNGNILSFDDVHNCLEYTGADAVMSAEALLNNPALFSSQNPPVWKIVEEYLHCAEKYNTPIRNVRCHLFRILYLCIHQEEQIQKILAEGSTLTDFHSVCKILKELPGKYGHFLKNKENAKDFRLADSSCSPELQNNSCEHLSPEEETALNHVKENNLQNHIKDCVENDVDDFYTSEEKIISEEIDLNDSEAILNEHYFQDDVIETKYLPIWLCHSRPRIADCGKTKGCYSKYFSTLETESADPAFDQSISKRKFRKALRHERVLAAKKKKRKAQKARRKQKIAEERAVQVKNINCDSEAVKTTKKQCKMLIRERLLKARGFAPKVCINLEFASSMETKDLGRLSSQLRRLYGSNRKSSSPLHLFFCALSPSDELYKICVSKNDGFASYMVEMTEKSPEEIFNLEDLIYLSPDAENILEELDSSKTYVIGGIVDGTIKKGVSLGHAETFNIQTAQLPIHKYLVKCSSNPGSTVLTVNQVFDILLKYYESGDWILALETNVPRRKGFCSPGQVDALSEEVSTLSTKKNVENSETNS